MKKPTLMSSEAWRLLQRALPGVTTQETGGGIVSAMIGMGDADWWMMFDAEDLPLGQYRWSYEDDEGNIVASGRFQITDAEGFTLRKER